MDFYKQLFLIIVFKLSRDSILRVALSLGRGGGRKLWGNSLSWNSFKEKLLIFTPILPAKFCRQSLGLSGREAVASMIGNASFSLG